jgi:hypothetical protein
MRTSIKTPPNKATKKEPRLNIALTASYALQGIVAEMKTAIEQAKQKKKGGFNEQ